MFRLLNIEFHKLKYNTASKVLTLIYFLLLTSTALIAMIKFDFAGESFHLADMGIFNFPYIWHLNTYLSATIKFFLLMVIVSMMSNEYSNKTLKQNLIDGLSKKEFILSKFYTVIVFSLISTLFVFIVSLLLGYIYSDFNELSIVFTDLDFLLAFFVKLVGFFSFGLFMGILVKRSAFAVGGIIVWFAIEGITHLILAWKFRGTDSNIIENIMQFFPLEAMSNLIKQPWTRFSAVKSIANQIGEDLSYNYFVQPKDILIVSIWTFIFIYFSYKLLKRRDL